MSEAVAPRDAEFVFGKFSGIRVSGGGLCPLFADDSCHRLDSALESPWKRLRVHGDANVGERSAIRDTDRLSGLH